MNDSTLKPTTFAACATKDEVKDLLSELNAEHHTIIRANKKAFNDRCKEIRKAELEPVHQTARRWRSGQKVYFGTGDNLSYMSFDDFRTTKAYTIEKGQWCYVWRYQPRSRRLWLCHPGKKCEFQNVIDHGFSLNEIDRCQISRTEIQYRDAS